jgi:hypothetical protein
MSLASGGYYVKVAQIEEQLEALDVSAGNLIQKIEDLSGSVIEFKAEFQDLSAQVQNLSTNKQDLLTAGTGIDITNNVISSTGGGSSFVGFRVFTTAGTHSEFLLNQTLTIDFDEGGNYDNVGSNRGYFIAPTNGYYSFKGKIRLPTGSNARSFVAFYIDRGSGRVEYESFYADLSVSSATTIARGQTSSCIAKLNAGDKMTLGLDATASTIGSPVVDIIFAGYKINDF